MIDSITLRIEDFILYSDKYFNKTKHQELKGKYGVFGVYSIKYTEYPKKCNKRGRYFPQVQIMERRKKRNGKLYIASRYLVIQVSLPKLVFATNLFDVTEELFPIILSKLQKALSEISITVSIEALRKATAVRLDFSKMVQIAPSYGTTDDILNTLLPYNHKQASDFNRSNYHNGRNGYYVKFFNSSQGFVIYDKFDEIVEHAKTNLEHAISQKYKDKLLKKGALRIEISLQLKQTLDSVLRRLSGDKSKKSFTFEEIFKTEYSKRYLLETYEKVYINGFNKLIPLSHLKNKKLEQIIDTFTTDFRQKALLYYLVHQVRQHGLKNIIKKIRNSTSTTTTNRYKKLIDQIIDLSYAKKDNVNSVTYLYRKLKQFKPVIPKNLEQIKKSIADK